jgi:hypothetical protein
MVAIAPGPISFLYRTLFFYGVGIPLPLPNLSPSSVACFFIPFLLFADGAKARIRRQVESELAKNMK